jgi:hypothetical protein
VRPRVSKTPSPIKQTPAYPALLLTQNAHRFYFTTIPIEDLFAYCFIQLRGTVYDSAV